jgi:Tfp pilus assembly protein PilF
MTALPLRAIALAASLFMAGCLGPGTPEEQLQSIQELQEKNLPVTSKQKTELDAHIAKGREALEAGNKEQAGEAFGKALAILKIAEDAAIFNKAD